jgi:hypothetical protein
MVRSICTICVVNAQHGLDPEEPWDRFFGREGACAGDALVQCFLVVLVGGVEGIGDFVEAFG